MKKETINIILTLLALLPMTFFLFISIYGLFNILSNFDINNTLILKILIFGIFGYAGLLMNLRQNKNLKAEAINFIFLMLGIVGFVLFNSLEGGLKSWKWILTIEEPNEWLMFVGPIIITIILVVIKGKRLKTLYHISRRKSLFVLAISILFFSCAKTTRKETENNFYYPNKETVIENKNSAKLDFEIFKSTEELLDSLSALNYMDKKAIFHFKESSNNFYIIPDYLGHPEGPPPAIKLKNIIELSYDSILKFESKYSIDSLPMVLKAEQKKFGNNTYLSDSPINTHILLYDSIHKIRRPLIKLLETIDQINYQAEDSLKFKIIFSDYLTREKNLSKQSENSKLNTFLENPIDLQKFKSITSKVFTTGVTNGMDYYLHPEIKDSIFYRYNYLNQWRPYLTAEIIVFKNGENKHTYEDKTEILIEMMVFSKDSDLGKANLVGLAKTELESEFGNDYLTLDNYIVYSNKNKVLILELNEAEVNSYRYIKLNTEKIDNDLLTEIIK